MTRHAPEAGESVPAWDRLAQVKLGGPGQLRADLVDGGGGRKYAAAMRPLDIQPIGNELAVKWADGTEAFITLERLRRACPCAGCKGEVDILGNLYKNPEKPYAPNAFELVKLSSVGGYAIQPVWADGHNTGIYSFEYLHRVAAVK